MTMTTSDPDNLSSHTWPETAEQGEDYHCLKCWVRWSKGADVSCDAEKNAPGEFGVNINREMAATKQAFSQAQSDHPRGILNLGRPWRVQLHVTHNDETQTFHPVTDRGWKIDASLGMLIIGKGLGRVYLPLCNIRYFSPEEY